MTYLEKLTYLTQNLTEEFVLNRLRCCPQRLKGAINAQWLITKGMRKRIDKLYAEQTKLDQIRKDLEITRPTLAGNSVKNYDNEELQDVDLKTRRQTVRSGIQISPEHW